MANKREKSKQNEASGSGSGLGGGSKLGAGESVPLSRQRERKVRYDQQGHQLRNIGVLFRQDLYEQYRRVAFFRHQHTYDLINEALAAYLPELRKSTTQKLREAGQELLDIE